MAKDGVIEETEIKVVSIVYFDIKEIVEVDFVTPDQTTNQSWILY